MKRPFFFFKTCARSFALSKSASLLPLESTTTSPRFLFSSRAPRWKKNKKKPDVFQVVNRKKASAIIETCSLSVEACSLSIKACSLSVEAHPLWLSGHVCRISITGYVWPSVCSYVCPCFRPSLTSFRLEKQFSGPSQDVIENSDCSSICLFSSLNQC